jgi:ABC-type multidrug transport system ATPase subunit
MDLISINSYTLKNLDKINILLGKNGCGKSTLLRQTEGNLNNNQQYGKTKYITPERGGVLRYEAGIEQNTYNDPNWMGNQRRKNQDIQFKPQSVVQYKKLETIILREIEQNRKDKKNYPSFDHYLNKLNELLDNVEIRRENTTFGIYKKGTNDPVSPDAISSGESELIALGIECLIFVKESSLNKPNILFLDEPDVHLHPDLQVRLMKFLQKLVSDKNIFIIIATHSTAILGALNDDEDATVDFMTFGQKEINFQKINKIYKKILPIFGAHPLSNLFNESPILLVEGEDDERVWQQVVRSSNGTIKLYPCACGSVKKICWYEKETKNIIKSVYEESIAYSLRDRDDKPEDIDDDLPIVRLRLSCRNAENLILTNEVLDLLKTNWQQVIQKIENWIIQTKQHDHLNIFKSFKNLNYDRKNFDLKKIRIDLLHILGTDKPWEVLVGQALSKIIWNDNTNFEFEGSILNYLSKKTTINLIPKVQL